MPASGGTGAVAVTAARECAWTASSENPWLTIKAGGSGQGDGTVQFEAVANPDPVVRRGAILANNQRAEVMQAAGECTISLAQDSGSFDLAGGAGRVDVRAVERALHVDGGRRRRLDQHPGRRERHRRGSR